MHDSQEVAGSGAADPSPPLVVFGLYNSGSTALAEMLHRMGVNMGAPFWMNDRSDSLDNHYEPYDLAWHLRRWWDEPRLVECAPATRRVCVFRSWLRLQRCASAGPVGAKHPLLSLCGRDLIDAWGTDTTFIWAYRPLADSVSGLKRRRWFPGLEEAMQRRLWEAIQDFEGAHRGVIRVEWRQILSDPVSTVRQLASGAGIQVHDAQLADAAAVINKPTQASERPR